MDKTNKITIFHNDWLKREEISQDVADLLKVQMLDIDDYILRGSVLTGDIDDMSKDEFVQKLGRGLFDTLQVLFAGQYLSMSQTRVKTESYLRFPTIQSKIAHPHWMLQRK